MLTAPQIDRLFFQSGQRQGSVPSSRCQHRLKLLYHHRFLERVEQQVLLSEGPKPLVYVLDSKGASLLSELWEVAQREVDWSPRDKIVKPLFLDHLLATNDVRISVTLAAKTLGFTVTPWLDERTLRREHMVDTVLLVGENGHKETAAVVPDSYFVLDTGTHVYHHFLEIDRATVTGVSSVAGRRDWGRKIAAYLAYYRSGKYEKRYQSTGLRILTVTTSDQRLANLKHITEQVGGKGRFWFSTFSQASEDILTAPIWQKAGSEGLHTLTW